MTSKFPSFLAIFVILLFVVAGVYSCSHAKTAASEPNDQPVMQVQNEEDLSDYT